MANLVGSAVDEVDAEINTKTAQPHTYVKIGESPNEPGFKIDKEGGLRQEQFEAGGDFAPDAEPEEY